MFTWRQWDECMPNPVFSFDHLERRFSPVGKIRSELDRLGQRCIQEKVDIFELTQQIRRSADDVTCTVFSYCPPRRIFGRFFGWSSALQFLIWPSLVLDAPSNRQKGAAFAGEILNWRVRNRQGARRLEIMKVHFLYAGSWPKFSGRVSFEVEAVNRR